MSTANIGSCGPVRFGGHAARVDDDQFGFPGRAGVVTRGAQPAGERFAIGARRPATEMLQVKTRHAFSVERIARTISFSRVSSAMAHNDLSTSVSQRGQT